MPIPDCNDNSNISNNERPGKITNQHLAVFNTPTKNQTCKKFISPTLQQLRHTPKDQSIRIKQKRLEEKFLAQKYSVHKLQCSVFGISVWPDTDVVKRKDWYFLLVLCLTQTMSLLATVLYLCGKVISSSLHRLNMLHRPCHPLLHHPREHDEHTHPSSILHACNRYLQDIMLDVSRTFPPPDCDNFIRQIFSVFAPFVSCATAILFVTLVMDRIYYQRKYLPFNIRIRCYAVTVFLSLLISLTSVLLPLILLEHRLLTKIEALIEFGKVDDLMLQLGDSGATSNSSQALLRSYDFCNVLSYWERIYHGDGIISLMGGVKVKHVQYLLWAYGFGTVSFLCKYLRGFLADIRNLYKHCLS